MFYVVNTMFFLEKHQKKAHKDNFGGPKGSKNATEAHRKWLRNSQMVLKASWGHFESKKKTEVTGLTSRKLSIYQDIWWGLLYLSIYLSIYWILLSRPNPSLLLCVVVCCLLLFVVVCCCLLLFVVVCCCLLLFVVVWCCLLLKML